MRLALCKPWQWIAVGLVLVTLYVASPALLSTRNALVTSDSFILYSLEPHGEASARQAPPGRPTFYGDPIMGQVAVNDFSLRAQLVDDLLQKPPGEFGAACFHPRYAIRARKGWRTIEVAICFDCWNVVFKQYGRGSGVLNLTSDKVKPIFDRTLQRAGVPQSRNIRS